MQILYLISENITPAILIFGMILGVLIIRNAVKLNSHKSKIDIILNNKNIRSAIRRKTGAMEEMEEEIHITPETLRAYEKDFNKTRSGFDMYCQLISIFPLLGILGTVSGLMNQVAAENLEALLASLDVALQSTLFGLIFAIGLKFVTVIWPGRIVDQVEIMLDNYYDKFDDSIKQGNILEE